MHITALFLCIDGDYLISFVIFFFCRLFKLDKIPYIYIFLCLCLYTASSLEGLKENIFCLFPPKRTFLSVRQMTWLSGGAL